MVNPALELQGVISEHPGAPAPCWPFLKEEDMRQRIAVATVLVFIQCVALPLVHGEFIDQQCTLNYTGWIGTIKYFEPLGQSFIPLFARNTGVDLWVKEVNAATDPASPLTVRMREGSMSGPVLSESIVTPPEGADGWIHFPLSFTATPGDVYVIDVEATNYRWAVRGWNASTTNDVYPLGQMYFNGVPNGGGDLNFRTWVVPEPATVCLLMLGGLSLMRRGGF